MLKGLTELERELIRSRTGETKARANAARKKMGRTPKLTPRQSREARARHAAGKTPTAIA